MTSVDRNIPSKMVSGCSKLPWLSAQLHHLIWHRKRIHTKYKKTGNNRLNTLWRKLRRKVTLSLRSERNQHLNKVIRDIQTNPKPFWKYRRSQRKDNQDMPTLKMPAGTTVDSDHEKAEALNTQFQNNWSHEDLNSIPFLRKTTPGIKNIVVTTNGIIRLVNDLKETSAQVAPYLKYIFQKSFETSNLPHDWRVATICPIYKKGERSCPNNYRPVSLTSVVCKVLEHIVCSNLMNHLDAQRP